VEDFGLFAQGVELPAEGLIHVDTLDDDFYRYDSATHSLAGHRSGNRYRLGDLIRVQVAHVDIDRRELDFRVVKRVGHAGESRRPQRDTPHRGREQRGTNHRQQPRGEKQGRPSGRKGRRR
jgi:ribonuclease R